MRRVLCLFVGMSLLLAACAGTAPTSTPAPTQAPAGGGGEAVSRPDYLPSDPTLVGTTGRPQIVVFFAFKCDICQSMRPTMHELEATYGTMVDFIYLDVNADNTVEVQQRLNITGSPPAIIFFNAEGQEKGRFVGLHNKTELETEIEDLVAVG
jgi:thiol-disulfide isomerase/thioredoxin